ncbi:MAG: energy transducer TonB [Acetobacteraceae bacterium]
MRRSAAASLGLHVLLVAALLIGLPFGRSPEPPPETAVDMVFQSPGPATKAPAPAPIPAPARTPLPLPAPPAPTPPTPQPLEDTTPPPPPPPPPAPAVVAPPTPITPPPKPTPTPAIAAPTPPKAAPPPPLPPLPLPPPPAPPSPTAQPNPTVNPAPSSPALQNTLEKLRAEARLQARAPTARPNPRQGGAPNSGGDPLANDTSALSASERGAIGDHVRPCWTTDPGALDLDKMQVLLTVTTDASGVVRLAVVAPADQGRVAADPRLRVFSERAVRAVLSSACANLPLPAKLLGKVNVLTFRFRP